jgi:predicted RND superfamily exporter protein
MARVETEFGYRPLLGAEHPAIRDLEGFIDRFDGGFPVRIAWECGASRPCRTVFDPQALLMADRVTRQLQHLPQVRQVHSPATTSLLVPTAAGLEVRQLVEHGSLAPDFRALAARAVLDPLWRDTLVTGDATAGAIIVEPVDSESETSVAVMETLFRALAPHEQVGFEFHLVGHAVEFVVAGRELAASSAALTPLTAAVIAAILLLFTRSWQAVVATLGMLGAALVWTFGLLGVLGWPHDSVLQTLSPLVLVTGACDAIHLLSRYEAEQLPDERLSSRSLRRNRLTRAAGRIALPCGITTATTAGAFLSFATSDLPTFVRFGAMAAFGSVACLALTFSLLPLLLLGLPAETHRVGTTTRAWSQALDAMVRTSERRRGPILGVTALLFLVFGTGWLMLLRVDTDGYEMYGERSRVIRWIRFVERSLGSSDTLEIEITLPAQGALEDPETLDRLSKFATSLSAIEGLGTARSVVQPISWLNRILHADDPQEERAANSRRGNAELIELLGFHDPDLLERWVSFDRRRVRVSIEAAFQSAARRGAVLKRVNRAVAGLPPGWEVLLTGPYATGYHWVRDVQETQLRSFLTALVTVFLIVAVYMRSPTWAGIAMIPTLLPAVVTLGAMGLLGLSLDVGRAMIAAVIIGIGIDDTIHLLSSYRERRRLGDSPNAAIREAVRLVGRAVVTTSTALALGFLSLMVSSWQTVSSFGFFVGIGILVALVADLLVLPALVTVLWSGKRERLG